MDRIFVAVPLTEAAREGIRAGLAAAFPRNLPGRPTPPNNWHLTLRFLGDAAPEAQAALVAELACVGSLPRFGVTFAALGSFPRPARATVLWVGIRRGLEPLADLAARAEQAAVRAGFPPERRPFEPHLTLSRSRTPLDLRNVLAAAPALGVEMPVEEVVLFRSILGSGTPRYQRVHTVPLQ
jgi:RNA 2',3'-cyclic 3'-phosphodiesterase